MEGSGLNLIPLSGETLEQVRIWRNDPYIARFMEFQEEISVEAQQKWFHSLQNAHYFVIYVDTLPIGLIHLKNTTKETAESGLFIGNEKFLGTGIAYEASLLLLDFAFNELKLLTVTAKVHVQNKVAEDYNQLFGYKFNQAINENFNEWVLTSEDYSNKRKYLQMILLK